jgi:hypothetical protein
MTEKRAVYLLAFVVAYVATYYLFVTFPEFFFWVFYPIHWLDRNVVRPNHWAGH